MVIDMYIETDKILGRGFNGELIAAGIPLDGHISVTSRRVIDGKVVKGFPPALHFPNMDESYRDAIQAVIDAHVPFFGHVDRKIAETKAEANSRILAILPEWKQRNYTARAVEKVAAGEVGDEEWNTMQTAWGQVNAVRTASDAIEAEIAVLSDVDAGNYNVASNSLWP